MIYVVKQSSSFIQKGADPSDTELSFRHAPRDGQNIS